MKHDSADRVSAHLHIIKYTLLYIFLSFLWIFSSDKLLHILVSDKELAMWISTVKGWLFVIVTAALYYTMMRRLANHIASSEKSYDLLFNLASEFIFMIDNQGRFVDANMQALKYLGYTREELLGMNLKSIVDPRDLAEIPLRIDQLRDGETILSQRNCFRKDGSRIVLESTIRMLPDGRIMSISRDITERMREEKKLRESEAKFTAVFTSNPIAATLTNLKDSRFVDVNDAFVEASGYTREELIGHDAVELRMWAGPEQRDQFLKEITAAGVVRGMEGVFRTKQGEFRHGLITGELIEVGGTTYLLTLMEDITIRKKAEEDLKRSEEMNRRLEEQLVRSQKLESLGTLASGIAHDFNNLLNIIMGHSALLPERISDPDKLATSIQGIAKASERGASLVRQLLTFARKTETVFEPMNVNDLVKEISKMLYETFPKTIEISTSFDERLPRINVDASQLNQVLMNLFLNARDAMPRGGTLTVRTSRSNISDHEQAPANQLIGDFALIEITDTGIGMSEETKKRIFDPFFTTKAPGKGTGLGLSLAYSIIENHRGRLEFDSELDKGTSFRIFLPIEDSRREEGQPASGHEEDDLGGSETIMIVEDEEYLVDIVQTTLTSGGYKVIAARDGEEALTLFAKHMKDVSVVITDLGLPKLGGEEVTRGIRKIDPTARIVLASGFIDPDTRSSLASAGVFEFMQKPYTPHDVLRTVRHVIDAPTDGE